MLEVSLETHLNTFHLEVSFSAEGGKTMVLLGESGAGKSTVLRLLAGLLHAERGKIALDGVTYFESERRVVVPPQERPFGYVFQDYALFPHLSVFENVAFGLRAQHSPREVIRRRVGEALEQVRLTGLDERRPAQLSGGQQQRVAIARALALQPQLLLLDEPLAALDVQTRREVRQELRHILANIGITTVFVTHQYLEALLFGQHILVLDHGRVIQQGSQRDLLERPRSAYVAELVGTNFFRGRVVRCETNAICTIQLYENGGGGERMLSGTQWSGDRERMLSGTQWSQHSEGSGGHSERSGGQGVEVSATLEERTQADRMPGADEEAYVVVDPRSITLYQTSPESSARNVFYGEIVQLLPLGSAGSNNGEMDDGRVRVSILLDTAMALPPLTAEITVASAVRMELGEGKRVYAAFKATEARAYM